MSTSYTITLTPEQAKKADEIGRARHESSVSKGHDHQSSRTLATVLEDNIRGARGEMAFAVFLGLECELTVDTFKDVPDVGGYEVRIPRLPQYGLVIKEHDPGDRVYVLVTPTAVPHRFKVRGWMMGDDARQVRWARRAGKNGFDRECHLVPQIMLRDAKDLL